MAEDVNHSVLPPLPFDLDDEDLLSLRVADENFYDESFTLINALKVSRVLGKIKKIKPQVFILGFDFSIQKGELSHKIKIDYASHSVDRNLMVHSHEHDFIQILNFFRENNEIQIFHVGNKAYSHISIKKFLDAPSIISKAKKQELKGNGVVIVAELTNNHLGDMSRLINMVELAKESGADLIKVQKRDVDSFYSREKLNSYYYSPFGKTLRDYRLGVELNEDMIQALDDKCKELEIDWFCSVLDYPSFEVIQKFNPKYIKIPSTISNHSDFHKNIAKNYHGPIVISTGYTDQSYEEYVLETFSKNAEIWLLHCVSSYPTHNKDCNIAVITHYKELAQRNKKIIPGYSSHDQGSLASVLAVAAGARMLEKHVKLGDVDWVHFDKVALDLESGEFRKYVEDVRKAEEALGSSIKRILPNEHHKYEVNNK